MDNIMIIEALDTISDDNLKRYLNEKQKIAGEKTREQIKTIMMIAACLVIVVSAVALFPRLFHGNHPLNNDYALINLYCNGEKLYFTDKINKTGLMAYDPKTNELQTLISDTRGNVFILDNGIYYYNTTGLYFRETNTGQTQQIMSFSLERDSVSTVNGEALFNTSIEGSCSNFVENGETIYFVYRAGKKLCLDEHYEIGREKWFIIYALKNSELTEIASTHYVYSFLHEKPFQTDKPDVEVLTRDRGCYYLHVYDNQLFYLANQNELHSIDIDSLKDTVAFTTEGEVIQLFWRDDLAYITEKEAFQTVLDLKERTVASRKSVSVELIEKLIPSCVFDPKEDIFYSVYNGNIIRYSFEDPESYSIVHTFSDNVDPSAWINLAIMDDKVYFVCSDPVNADADWNLYRINDGKEELLIKGNKEGITVEKKE